MPRTSNVFARIEPEIKEQAESILGQLGIPMSNAIGLFLRQVVIQQGIPFDLKLVQRRLISIGSLSEEEFNAEIEKGFEDVAAGRMRPFANVLSDLKRDYGI